MSLRDRVATALGSGYRIERELGGGGMSHVFVAEELALGRRVVVKVLPPEMAATVNAERFANEVRTVASLQHPNIVPLIAAGGQGDLLWFTMPYVEGEELRARLTREGALPIADAVRLWSEMLDALSYAHGKGVIHRDIKPENVLLSGRHALVADFGVSKALSGATGERSATMTGLSIGTPAYMAPEQGVADSSVDHRVDIYAAGLVMYEMLTGRGPFPGRTPVQLLVAHATEMPAPVRELRAEVGPSLEALVMRCLAKDPAERPATAQEVISALATVTDASAMAAAVIPRSGTQTGTAHAAKPRWSKGRRVGVALAVVAAILAGGVLAAPRLMGAGGNRVRPDSARLNVFVLPVMAEAADSLLARSLSSAVAAPLRNDSRIRFGALEEIPFLGASRDLVTRDTLLLWMPDLGVQLRVDLTLARANAGYIVRAAVVTQATGATLVSEQQAAASAAELPDAVASIAATVRRAAEGAVGKTPRPDPDGRFSGTTATAARLSRDAENMIRSGDLLAAADLYRASLRADSTQPLALIGLYWALADAGVGTDERLRAMSAAYRHRARMPFPEASLYVEAEYRRATADWEGAIRSFAELERTRVGFTGDNQLGLALNSLRRFDDAAREFGRLRDTSYVDPSFLNSNYVTALLDLGRADEARQEYALLRSNAGEAHPVTLTVEYALLNYDRLHDSIVVRATADLERAKTPGARNTAAFRLMTALSALGRVKEAEKLRLARAERLAGERHPATRLANKLTNADSHVRATGDSATASRMIDDALRETPFESLAPMDRPFSTAIQALSHTGRLADARRISVQADREIPEEFKAVFAPNLAATRLELALGERDGPGALVQARLSDKGACAPCRFGDYANVWDLIGNADSTLYWNERFITVKSSRVAGFDAQQLARAYRRAGELHEQRGDLRKAIERYRQFVEIWKNADAELQPQLEEVRARIRRLESQVG